MNGPSSSGATAFVISHPEVVVDPAVPVPRWRLSGRGAARMRRFAAEDPALARLGAVWSSEETKAVEAAEILAARSGLPVRRHPDLGENDRSATGYLPPAEFERLADAFFARPTESIRGWERAVDAQARIAAAVDQILAGHPPGAGDVALVCHGGVGTLLLCRVLGVPIARALDQPGQGHVWAFEVATGRVLHRWRSITPG